MTFLVMCAHWDDQRNLNTGGEQISKNDPKMSGVHSGVYQKLKQQQLALEWLDVCEHVCLSERLIIF